MNTLLLNANHSADIEQCAILLRAGALVAVPSETVYGLAADARNSDAVAAIFRAKGRPANHPLIVHLPGLDVLPYWANSVSDDVYKLAEAFWPGPLTLLLPKAPSVSSVVTGGLNTIGVRVPSHPVFLSLLQQYNLALAAPSANLYKKLSPTSAAQVMAGMQGRVSAVLDGGNCEFGLESTIVDMTTEEPTIVRAGPITAGQIAAVLGKPVQQPQQHNVSVSGNVKAHYQPDKPLLCFSREQLLSQLPELKHQVALLHYSAFTANANVTALPMPATAPEYAQRLYQTLFAADQLPVSAIWCELPPVAEQWRAVHDRLSRAAYSQS